MSDLRNQFVTAAMPFMRNVYGAALRLSGKPDVAEDVTQETYLRAFRTFDRFAPGTDCKAWLLTIMHSILINRYHYSRRHPEASLDALDPDTDALASSDGQLTALFERMLAPEVEAALAALPEAFRSVVVLVDMEELTYEEAAHVLDCPVGTVRSRLYRARKLLFGALHEHARRAGYVAEGSGTHES